MGLTCRALTLITCLVHIQGYSYYGNELIQREETLAENGKRIMVEHDVMLGAGYLQTFSVYIHEMAPASSLPPVHLQVWTVRDMATRTFTLKWEMRLELDRGSGRLYNVSMQDRMPLEITPDDKIGFMCPSAKCPMSYTYVLDRKTYIKPLSGNDVTYPKKSQHLSFSGLTFPAAFSLGIEVGKDPPSGSILQFCGNAISPGGSLIPSGWTFVWIDDVIQLTNGRLESYHIYTGDVVDTPTIRLQIWTKQISANGRFTLKWETVQRIPSGNQAHEFSLEGSGPYVTSSDRLGWMFDDAAAPIMAEFTPGYTTYVYNIANRPKPVLDTTITVEDLPHPYKFSVGVMVRKGSPPVVEGKKEEPRIFESRDGGSLASIIMPSIFIIFLSSWVAALPNL